MNTTKKIQNFLNKYILGLLIYLIKYIKTRKTFSLFIPVKLSINNGKQREIQKNIFRFMFLNNIFETEMLKK